MAVLLSLIGGAAGVAIGAGSTASYAHAHHEAIVIPTEAWAGGLGAAVVIGALAGLLPAIRAARLSPTRALWSVLHHTAVRADGTPYDIISGQNNAPSTAGHDGLCTREMPFLCQAVSHMAWQHVEPFGSCCRIGAPSDVTVGMSRLIFLDPDVRRLGRPGR